MYLKFGKDHLELHVSFPHTMETRELIHPSQQSGIRLELGTSNQWVKWDLTGGVALKVGIVAQ